MSLRSVAATQCNEHSSRSHFVFRLNIDGANQSLGQNVNGVLNLVDLAGSERLSKSQATGDRLKETQSINKSLSALGDVIMAINNGDSHVPYRNSKLTWLLQPCLGNQSKALMSERGPITRIRETLCSLRFASKVNACRLEQPRDLCPSSLTLSRSPETQPEGKKKSLYRLFYVNQGFSSFRNQTLKLSWIVQLLAVLRPLLVRRGHGKDKHGIFLRRD